MPDQEMASAAFQNPNERSFFNALRPIRAVEPGGERKNLPENELAATRFRNQWNFR